MRLELIIERRITFDKTRACKGQRAPGIHLKNVTKTHKSPKKEIKLQRVTKQLETDLKQPHRYKNDHKQKQNSFIDARNNRKLTQNYHRNILTVMKNDYKVTLDNYKDTETAMGWKSNHKGH